MLSFHRIVKNRCRLFRFWHDGGLVQFSKEEDTMFGSGFRWPFTLLRIADGICVGLVRRPDRYRKQRMLGQLRERSLCLLNSEHLDPNLQPWVTIADAQFHPDVWFVERWRSKETDNKSRSLLVLFIHQRRSIRFNPFKVIIYHLSFPTCGH